MFSSFTSPPVSSVKPLKFIQKILTYWLTDQHRIHPQNFIKKGKFIIIGEFYWLLNFLAKMKEIDFFLIEVEAEKPMKKNLTVL